MLERANVGGLEVLLEREQLAGLAGPEGVGAANGFLIESLVLVEVLQVSSDGVFVVESLGDVEGVDLLCFQHLDKITVSPAPCC